MCLQHCCCAVPCCAVLCPAAPEPPGKGIKADAADESDDDDATGEQLVGCRRRGAAEGLQETCTHHLEA
jgi:hypothetical protein